MQKGFVKKENQSKRTFSFVSFFNSFHFFVCAADEPRFLIGRPPSNQSKPLRHGSDPTPTAGIGERGESWRKGSKLGEGMRLCKESKVGGGWGVEEGGCNITN